MTTQDFEKTGAGNYLLMRDGYCFSYNPSPWIGVPSFMSDHRGPETALIVDGDKIKWRILNGDFREEYKKCKTLSACLAFYESKKEDYQSSWSSDYLQD